MHLKLAGSDADYITLRRFQAGANGEGRTKSYHHLQRIFVYIVGVNGL